MSRLLTRASFLLEKNGMTLTDCNRFDNGKLTDSQRHSVMFTIPGCCSFQLSFNRRGNVKAVFWPTNERKHCVTTKTKRANGKGLKRAKFNIFDAIDRRLAVYAKYGS